jgi:F420H(2)-dependent quinone reductase
MTDITQSSTAPRLLEPYDGLPGRQNRFMRRRRATVHVPARATRPPVEERIPPRLVLRVVNPLLRALLRSPFHRLLSSHVMLIAVRGRKTGRVYTVPVGRHESDGTFLVCSDGPWRRNLRGGAPVTLTVDGCERTGYAELEENPDEVAAVYHTLINRYGRVGIVVLGLRINIGRRPTVDEIKPAVTGRAIARVRLEDDGAPLSVKQR